MGDPGGVFNFTVSKSGEENINKLTSDSDSWASTTFERSRKVKNSTMSF